MKRDDSVTVERYSYTWDNMDRPLQVRHSLGYGAEVVLTDLSYDLLGRVAEDRRNGNDSLRTAYSYNIRSWQTGIESPLFTEHLYREDRREGRGSNTPRYSGGISGTDWCLSGEKSRGYDYFYDGLDRLTGASYLEEGKRADGYGTAYTYDSHGNITTLERQRLEDNGTERTDIMTMAYDGNRLCSVNGESGITWDRNGNLTSDTSAGIVSVSWNSLNLPERFETVASDGVATAEYLYDAGGRKLRVRSIGSAGDTTVTDYTGNAVWKDGSLDRLLVDGGYIEDGEYRYLITDHLGSVRGVADAEGDLLFRTHYYPYGAEYGSDAGGNPDSGTGQGQNTGQDTGQGTGSDGATSEQPYRYNGKEAQSFAGVPLLDYGARLYSTRTGQWVSSDPLGEEYWSISPYAYCAGNPVRYIDPDGNDIAKFDTNGNLMSYKERKGDDVVKIVSIDSDSGKRKVINKQKFKDGTITRPNIEDNEITFNSQTESEAIFIYLALNTDVEWSLVEYSDGTSAQIGNSHGKINNTTLRKSIYENRDNVSRAVHNHPGEPYASDKDKRLVRMVKRPQIVFQIYYELKNEFIEYDEEKTIYKDEMYYPFAM